LRLLEFCPRCKSSVFTFGLLRLPAKALLPVLSEARPEGEACKSGRTSASLLVVWLFGLLVLLLLLLLLLPLSLTNCVPHCKPLILVSVRKAATATATTTVKGERNGMKPGQLTWQLLWLFSY